MTETHSPEQTQNRRRLRPRHAVYALLILIVVVCVVLVSRLGIDSATNLDNGRIERLIPSPGAKILQQDIIGIDLAPGYEGSLALNGQALPLDQVLWVPELNQITFRAGPGKVYEKLPAGENCLIATYWPTAFGPTQSLLKSWCFTVI